MVTLQHPRRTNRCLATTKQNNHEQHENTSPRNKKMIDFVKKFVINAAGMHI